MKRIDAVIEKRPLLKVATSFSFAPRVDDVRARLTAMGDVSTDWQMVGRDLSNAIGKARRELGVD